MKKLLVVCLLAFTHAFVWAQEGGIKGKVLDKITQQPLPGVVVVLSDSSQNAVTDTNGVFIMPKVKEGKYALQFSMIGYMNKALTDVLVIRNKTYYTELSMQEEAVSSEEVVVTGYKYENDPTTPVSTYGFSREEIFRNPGAQGDIFRAIGMLPGVSSSGGQFSAIAVRGQGTRDNVYMVDDIPMLDLGHLEGNATGFQDPNGGRFSIFAPKVVNEAKFQGGGFSALYGRKSSSYLGLGIKEGNRENASVDGQFDLLGFTVNYDGPSHFHKKTGIFMSVRYQDFKVLLNLINRKDIGKAYYGDLVLKTTSDIGKKHKLSFLMTLNPEGFGRGLENVKEDKDIVFQNYAANGATQKGLVGLNLRTLLNKSSYIKNVLYYRQSQTGFIVDKAFTGINPDGTLDASAPMYLEKNLREIRYNESELGYRSIFTHHFENKSTFTGGVDLQQVSYSSFRNQSRGDTAYSFTSADIQLNPSQKFIVTPPIFYNNDQTDAAYNASAYVDYSFEPIKRLTFNTGLRYDYTGFTDAHNVSPRLSANMQIDPKNSVSMSTGVFYQDPIYFQLADQSKSKGLKNERVFQLIGGYKHHFSPDLKFTIEPWCKSMDNLVVQPITGARFLTNDGTGYAYGIDLNLNKRLTEKYHGQVGYSFMNSRRNDQDGKGEYNYTYSQPHQVNMLLSYEASKRWILSTKFRYATGRPTDKYIVHSNVLNNVNQMRYSRELVQRGGDRFPDFISWDVRADYRVQFSKFAIAYFIDIVNVLNRFNINTINFNEYNGKDVNDGVAIFPTFGLRIEY